MWQALVAYYNYETEVYKIAGYSLFIFKWTFFFLLFKLILKLDVSNYIFSICSQVFKKQYQIVIKSLEIR